MQISQPLRRVAYAAFGVAPVSYLIWSGLPLPLLIYKTSVFREFSAGALLHEACAITGTLGLWCAMLMHLPVVRRWVRITVSTSLVVGILAMAPWSLIVAYSSVANVFEGSSGDPFTLSTAFAYASNTIVVLWWFVGPVIVAAHFLLLERRSGHLTIG
jgi:hypothetical protein